MKRLAFSIGLFLAVIIPTLPSFALTIDEFLGNAIATSDTVGVSQGVITSNASAIGGKRALKTTLTGGLGGVVRIETITGRLSHTQGSVTGQSIVTWDKDNDLDNITANGLGVVDLTQDGGNAIDIALDFFDYPLNQTLDLQVILYGGNNTKYSAVTVTLSTGVPSNSPFKLSIPFSKFTAVPPNASTVPGPNGSSFTTQTFWGPGGSVDVKQVGAIQLFINGQNNSEAPDLLIGSFKTNGVCTAVPDADGKVIDDCGVCAGDPNYKKPKDDCGICFNQPGYQTSKDDCGVCFGNNAAKDECGVCFGNNGAKDTCGVCFGNNAAKDDCGICFGDNQSKDNCGLCPSAPNYNNAKDPCGVCFGNGTTCADCSGTPNGTNILDICGVCAGSGTTCLDCTGTAFGSKGLDICNVCAGNGTSCLDCKGIPFGPNKIDACGTCGGTVVNASDCDVTPQCVTVQATSDILTFEKRLVEQAKTITKKYKEEDARNKKNKCGINTKPSTKRVSSAYGTITAAGKDIFTKGVEICGESCVTVSFADQVTALAPTLKIIEKETTTLAKKVKACYQKKKIQSVKGVAGVATTIKDVQKDLTQLIKDCQDKQVCPH